MINVQKSSNVLQEFLEQPGEGPTEARPAESSPFCEEHSDVNVSMLCVRCYQPVCLKCCLATPEGEPPKHFQHEVIPGDNVSEYIQVPRPTFSID